MHAYYFAFAALETSRERTLEAERRARLLRGAGPLPASLPRRVLERLAAWAGRARGDRVAYGGGAA